MTTDTKLMTADELLRMPEDGSRYELIRGELTKMAPSGQQHGDLAARVLISLGQHVSKHRLGKVYAAETGFKLASNPDHVRAPDAAFIREERLRDKGEVTGYWPGAPDLVLEVVSPSDSYAEVEDKVFDWLEFGCRMVIVVNPRNKTITVRRSRSDVKVLSEKDVLDGAEVVPGWKLPLQELFA